MNQRLKLHIAHRNHQRRTRLTPSLVKRFTFTLSLLPKFNVPHTHAHISVSMPPPHPTRAVSAESPDPNPDIKAHLFKCTFQTDAMLRIHISAPTWEHELEDIAGCASSTSSRPRAAIFTTTRAARCTMHDARCTGFQSFKLQASSFGMRPSSFYHPHCSFHLHGHPQMHHLSRCLFGI